MPGTVWLRHAGYGVVEDWVGVGVGVAVADGVAEELSDELGVGELVVGDADGDVVGVVVAASSGPLNWLNLVRAPAMPAKPNRASVDSAQLARSACHQLVCSPVFGVRRNAAFLVNRASTDARATTSDVDCQIKNAPRASRQDAPVPRRSRAIARTRPSSTITGMAETRNRVSLRKSCPPPVVRLTAPASRKMKNSRLSRSPYHCAAPAR